MILMNQGALDALDEQAFDEGWKKGREEAEFEWRLVAAQHKKLAEILEVEGDQNLMDAVEHLGQEVRSHRDAQKLAASVLEAQRKKINELAREVLVKEEHIAQIGQYIQKLETKICDLQEKCYGAGVVEAAKEMT